MPEFLNWKAMQLLIHALGLPHLLNWAKDILGRYKYKEKQIYDFVIPRFNESLFQESRFSNLLTYSSVFYHLDYAVVQELD